MTALDHNIPAEADVRFVAADPSDPNSLPWAEFPGGKLRLLRVDLGIGEWVVQNVFDPGFSAPRHRHTGHVDAYTIRGSWQYLEYGVDYGPGSYVYEPAFSTHQLHVPASNDGQTEVIFVMRGANLNLDDDGNVTSITDAEGTLAAYVALCEMQGFGTPSVLR
jgi:uncharacterized RmlC-like cupin family protein